MNLWKGFAVTGVIPLGFITCKAAAEEGYEHPVLWWATVICVVLQSKVAENVTQFNDDRLRGGLGTDGYCL